MPVLFASPSFKFGYKMYNHLDGYFHYAYKTAVQIHELVPTPTPGETH